MDQMNDAAKENLSGEMCGEMSPEKMQPITAAHVLTPRPIATPINRRRLRWFASAFGPADPTAKFGRPRPTVSVCGDSAGRLADVGQLAMRPALRIDAGSRFGIDRRRRASAARHRPATTVDHRQPPPKSPTSTAEPFPYRSTMNF